MKPFKPLIIGCLFLVSFFVAADELATPLPADVRVIIDISGSMKKTDPQNLRKPAVDLIVRLLPDKSKAGLWTFGQSVNMLMPHRVVDQAWRAEGAQKANGINSIAMFTHIGLALEKATEDYQQPATDYHRDIILLTDGVVDISKEAVENLNERKRILTELLPRLKKADYRIHTIALSNAADQELMKKLSIATDGVFAVANNADELMSTFLRIFDQAVPAERVPLDENGFLVDASINEFTALIFRRAEVPATIIIAPDGSEYTGTDPAHNINWYRTDKYDLITVQQPPAGQWKIKTEMAPGSRVTVVSDLQLVVQPPKSNLRTGQTLEVNYAFNEGGEKITNADFLAVLSGKAIVSGKNSPEVRALELSGAVPADGIFNHELTGFDSQGEYDVKIVIDGKTFKREFVHHLNINDSAFKLDKRVEEQAGKKVWAYTLTADLEMVDVNHTKVTAIIKNSQSNNLEKALNTIGKDHWEFSFSPVQTARYDIILQVEGQQLDGSPLTETIKADQFYYPDEATVMAAEKSPVSSAAASLAATEHQDEPVEPEAEQQAESEESNLWLYVAIGAAHLLVIGLGYVAYCLVAGKGNKAELAEMEKTLAATVASEKPPAAAKTSIDVSADGDMGDIPMGDSSVTDMSMADDLMADNLFPLDSMDDSDKDKP